MHTHLHIVARGRQLANSRILRVAPSNIADNLHRQQILRRFPQMSFALVFSFDSVLASKRNLSDLNRR